MRLSFNLRQGFVSTGMGDLKTKLLTVAEAKKRKLEMEHTQQETTKAVAAAGRAAKSNRIALDHCCFLTEYQGVADSGLLQPEFVNFHYFAYNSPEQIASLHPIKQGHCLWVYHCKWKRQASCCNKQISNVDG